MKIEMMSKNYKIGDKLTDVVTKKLSRLDKYFDKDVKAKVVCKKEKDTHIMEVTVLNGSTVIRAESRSIEDMYSLVDVTISKLVRQVNKHKSKFDDKLMKDFSKEQSAMLADVAAIAEEKDAVVVKKKVFSLSPMSVEDAIFKLDLLDHNFYVFLNNDSGRINVLYKRLDGDYGIIETVE